MHSSFFVPHPYGVLPRGNAPDDERALLSHRFGGSFAKLLLSLPSAQTTCEELIVGSREHEDYFSVANASRRQAGVNGVSADAEKKEADLKKAPASHRKKASASGSSHITGGGNVAQFADEGITIGFLADLVSFMDVKELCVLGATCSGWYTFLHANGDVWRRQHLMMTDRLQFAHDWKTTVVRLHLKELGASNAAASKYSESFIHTPLKLSNRLYCDTLFQSWICTNLPSDFGLIKKSAITVEKKVADAATEKGGKKRPVGATMWNYRSKLKTVDVIDVADLTEEVFDQKYEKQNVPLVIKRGCVDWPLYKLLNNNGSDAEANAASAKSANVSNLASLNSSVIMGKIFTKDGGAVNPLQCESFKMTPKEYVSYASHQQDERPTYLFDPEFGETSMDVPSMYTVPHIFERDDYFKHLGENRPKYRWIIAGPARGGSNFHVDPNFTSAWNACITGRKRWLFFPPHSPPCGVYPSADMADVTTPETLSEWLLNFYTPTVETMRNVGYECICDAGDIAFVPCGWWHLVINLEDSIAITQNYISRNNLGKVLMFLKFMQKSISGVGEDDCEEFNKMSTSGGDVVSTKACSNMGMMSLASVCSRQSNLRGDLIAALQSIAPDVLKEALSMEDEALERKRKRALVRAGVTRAFQRLPLEESDEEAADGANTNKDVVGGKRERGAEVNDEDVQRQSIDFDNGLADGFQF